MKREFLRCGVLVLAGFLACAVSAGTAAAAVRNVSTGVSYPTLQAALNAASPGDTVEADGGTYEETLLITVPVTLRSAVGVVVVTPPPGSATNAITINVSGGDVVLRGVVGAGASLDGIRATGSATATLVLDQAGALSNGQHGLHATTFANVIIQNGSMRTNRGDGIRVRGVAALSIVGGAVENNTGTGVLVEAVADAFNLVSTTITGNGVGLRAVNAARAGGGLLESVVLRSNGGSPAGRIEGFGAVTVNVTEPLWTTDDAVTITAESFTAAPGGVLNDAIAYANLGSLSFFLFGGNDQAAVRSTTADTVLTLELGAGNDAVAIGSAAGSLDDVPGTITVAGEGGADTVQLLDHGDDTHNAYTISAASIERRAPGAAATTINYNSSVEAITLNAGSGDDRFTVAGSAAAVHINGNDGGDMVLFHDGAGLSGGSVTGGAGFDRLDYTSYTTAVAVSLSADALFTGRLQGAQEVPPTDSTASGLVLLVHAGGTTRFDMRLAVNGLSAASISGVHVHAGAAGANGPVILDLGPLAPWHASGATLVKSIAGASFATADDAAQLLAGTTYVNVHTSSHPAGAVRAQLRQAVAPNSATGTGGVFGVEQVYGGAAGDLILGSEGRNLLVGEGGNDVIFGRGGEDVIGGLEGDDLVFGDDGVDFLGWTSGEGSDVIEGGEGIDRAVFGGAAPQSDFFRVSMQGQRVSVARTNLAPAVHDVGSVETIELFGFAGDDIFVVEPLAGVELRIDGGVNGSDGDVIRYDALCGTVTETPSTITHSARGPVTREGVEATQFQNRTVVTPQAPSFAAAGGSGTLTVATGASCAWNTRAAGGFVQITAGETGSGSGVVTYRVLPNLLASIRNGSVTVAGAAVPVQQAGASIPPDSPYDMNGDSGADLLLHHSTNGSIAAWFMNERVLIDGSLLNPGAVADLRWQVVGMGDFNGDARPDVLWQRTDTGRLAVWLMNGTNRTDVVLLTPERTPNPAWRVRAVGDMNGDRHPDLVLQHATEGFVGVWFMNGTRQVDGRLLDPGRTSVDWTIVGTGDLNRDGRRDLVWQHADGTLAAWFMNGATRLDAVFFNPPRMSDTAWRIRGVTDVNADGRPDLLMQHPDGRMAAFLLNGTSLVDGVLFVPSRTMDPAWRLVGPR